MDRSVARSLRSPWPGLSHFGVMVALVALVACSDEAGPGSMDAAQAALASGDLSAAVIHYKSALQRKPEDVEARLGLGRAFLLQGDVDGAVIELGRAADGGAPAGVVAPLLAQALVEAGDHKRVVQQFAGVKLDGAAEHAALQVELARAWAALGDARRTEQAIAAALERDPGQPKALLMQARLKAVRGDLTDAAAQIDALLSRHPDLVDAWSFRGDLHRVAGDESGALAAYQRALSIQPTHMASHVATLGVRIRAGDRDAARRQLEAMEKSAPSHPVTFLARAEQSLYEGNLVDARDRTQALLRAFPDHGGILVLAGTVEAAMGSVVQAASHFGKALGQDPSMVIAREGLASAEIRLGQYSKALSTLAPLLGADGRSPRAFALAGEAHIRLGNPEAAAGVFRRAVQLNPSDSRLKTAELSARMLGQDAVSALAELRQLAERSPETHADRVLLSAYLARREFDRALEVVNTLERKAPDDASVVELKGRVLAARGDRAGARAAFEAALVKDPSLFGALSSLVELDVAGGNAADAEKRLRAEAGRSPGNPLPLLALADLRARAGAPAAEVAKLLDDAVKANPSFPEARQRQIAHTLQRRMYKEALAQAQSALSALPTDTGVLEAMGLAQLQSGDTEQAAGTFRRLVTATPGNPAPYMRLAEVYRVQGKHDQAEVALRNALDMAPGDPQVIVALAELLSTGPKRDEALQLARRMREVRPTQPIGYLLEAELHLRRGDREAAANSLSAGMTRAPASVVAARLHGLLIQSGRGAEADRLAGDWLKKHPGDTLLDFQVAMREASQGQFRSAEERLRRVVAANPSNALAQNNLASVILANGGKDAARFAQRANEISPGQPQYMDTLAAALAGEGRINEALDLQRRAISIDAQDLQLKLGLAKLLVKSGDKPAARAALETLRAAGPAFPRQAEVSRLLADLGS